MQKLDQTEDNLTRVEDILFDLEGRVEPLREEAAIAKEYKHLSSEMEKSDVLVTVYDIGQYNQNIYELDENLNRLKSQQASKDAEKAQHTQSLNQYKSERQQLDEKIESLNFKLVKATEEVEKFAGQLNVLEERKKNQSQTNARFEEEQESLETQVTNLKARAIRSKRTNQTVKTKQNDLNEEIQQYESQLYVSDEQHDEKLESIKDEYYQLMSEQSDVNNDIRF